jgi:hypothetical protein
MTDAKEKNESGKGPYKSGGVFSKNSKKVSLSRQFLCGVSEPSKILLSSPSPCLNNRAKTKKCVSLAGIFSIIVLELGGGRRVATPSQLKTQPGTTFPFFSFLFFLSFFPPL